MKCNICGKLPNEGHTSETRNAHADHYTRVGYSLMCPSPVETHYK